MDTTTKTLLLAPRYDDDSQLLWEEAVRRGWRIDRLDGYRVTPLMAVSLTSTDPLPTIYGGHIWGKEIARQLGLGLLSPAADWLQQIDVEFKRRCVQMFRLGDVRSLHHPLAMVSKFPLFVKSLHWPQEFASRVYLSPDDLPALGDDVQVLVSGQVVFDREFRAFVLDGEIRAFSPYSRGPEGVLDMQLSQADVPVAEECHGWLSDALMELADSLPRAVVVDVGMVRGRGPAIVEANPAWCSGIYRCDPVKVLDVVAACVVRT